MKVVQLNTYNTGGAANACLRLHKGLLAQGVDSKVLLLYNTHNGSEVYDHRDSLSKTKALALKAKNYAFEKKVQAEVDRIASVPEFFSSPESVWRPEENPIIADADIIHLHWVARFINYPSFFAAVDKPIVWTIHDFNPFTGGFHYHHGVDLAPFQKLYTKNIEQKMAALNDASISCVTPSAYLAAQSSASGVNGRFEHTVIENAVDTSVYRVQDRAILRNELGLPLDKNILLFVSDLIEYERKGFSELTNALTSSQLDCEVAIVGRSDNTISIEGYRVHELGHLNDEQLARVYGAADLFVNPSLADISSNTVMESLSCGTPVVVYPTGGVPELVRTGDGLICADPKPQDLHRSITAALDTQWDRHAIAGRASKRFSLERLAKEYLAVYDKLIS